MFGGSSARDYDVVVFGASGFTGVQVCKQIQALDLTQKWAVAGRNAEKLQGVVKQLDTSKPAPGVVVADVQDQSSLVNMCQQARLLMNVTGPYRFYGEPVVKACLEAKTDYIDVCGEPEFMESILLRYQEEAVEKKVVICHACAFDSVPADVGIAHCALLYAQAGGVCTAVEAFHTFEAPSGYSGHATTFEAAVHGIGAAAKLKELRQELDAKCGPVPKSTGQLKRNDGIYYYEPRLQSYAVPFIGSDASVVRSTRRVLKMIGGEEEAKKLSPQFAIYFTVEAVSSLLKLVCFGGVFQGLAKWAWGQQLLIKYPSVFTAGTFSEEGPTSEQMANNRVVTKFFSQGEINGQKHSALLEVGVEDPGYIGTGLMFCTVAATVLGERDSLTAPGGVFTPAALLYKTTLVERLRRNGVRFEVVQTDIP